MARPPTRLPAGPTVRPCRLRPLAPGLAILAVALVVRLALLVRSGWLLEGDDSLSTLMALAILEGDRPIMLKNQAYAGAWQPYAMAVAFALLGVSRVAAKLPVLLASLALVGATGLLAREVAGRAAGWFAALLVAVAPIYVLVMSLKPWAPYTEVMVLGSLTLLCATRLAFPRGRPTDGRWAVAGGVAGGLAFWLHPLAAYYLVPAALVVLLRVRGGGLAAPAGLGLLGFAVGALPVWVYNLQTGGATVRFVTAGTAGQTADRLAVLGVWWNADLPRAAGLWQPWGASPRALAAAVAAILALAVAWSALWRPRRVAPPPQQPQQGAPRVARSGTGEAHVLSRDTWARPLDVPLLLLLAIPALFVASGFGGPGLNPWGFDATGRYAPPLWNGLAVVLGAFLAAAWAWRRWVAGTVLAALLAAFLYGWVVADPVAAFQSPYWPRLPVDTRPLLAALQRQGISYVWLNHWAAFPLMFDARTAGQTLVAYDWYDAQAGGIDRFPEYRPLVEGAERPGFVLVTDEAEPELLARLEELGVAYVAERVAPYVLVIPTSRRVHPSEVAPALDYRY